MKQIFAWGMLALVAGCRESSTDTPAAQAGANVATANDCAAILQNVRAGRDLIVNVKCDVPTEAKLIAALSTIEWKGGCTYSYPVSGWQVNENEGESSATLLPNPGSYWSQYGFSVGIMSIVPSQVDYAYANGHEPGDIARLFPAWDPGMIERVEKIRALYPSDGSVVPTEADELLMSDETVPLDKTNAALRATIADYLEIRRQISYEDGSELGSLRLAIRRNADRLETGVMLYPYVDAYPSWPAEGDDKPKATQLSCQANKTMNMKSFKALCTMFLERHTLADETTNGEACQTTEH